MPRLHPLSGDDIWKTLAVGIVIAAITAAMMLLAIKNGISPLPKPLALAFAGTLAGRPVPMSVGFALHAAWVTCFTFAYVVLFRDRLGFIRAFVLAFLLWVSVLVVFFPVVGWGFLGLAVGPQMIVASAIPHLLFAILIWAGSNLLLRQSSVSPAVDREHR